MAFPAIQNYSDEKLADLLNAVLAEQERRQRRERFPADLADRARTYLADGGDAETLRTALDAALEPAPADVEETSAT